MTLAAVVVHPHPGMGGDSSHPLVSTIARRLDEAGVAAATPNIGDPDFARASSDLAHIASDHMVATGADRLVLVGYSWGSVVSTLVSVGGLVGRVLIAPPVKMMSLGPDDHLGGLVLVPTHDDYGGPEAVGHALDGHDGFVIEPIDGADHFLVGAVDRVAERVVAWVGQV